MIDEFNEKLEDVKEDELKVFYNKSFEKNIESTRDEVFNYFDFFESCIVKRKELAKIYPLYLSLDSLVRRKYVVITSTFRQLCDRLAVGSFIQELTDEENDYYIKGVPIDKEINLAGVLQREELEDAYGNSEVDISKFSVGEEVEKEE